MRRLVAHDAGAFPAILTFVVVLGASYAVARYLLKEKIAKKKANRDKMIESRMAKMSGDGDDWED